MYYESISQVIQEGGDTDTNACIAGGMLGALLGIKSIPEYMVKKVITFDCTKVEPHARGAGRFRPVTLNTRKHALKNIKEIIKIRPKGKVTIVK